MNTSKVKYFLMFMGYPRSGHTLVASMLNAHPNVVCSNQLFIIQNAEKRNLNGILANIANGSTPAYWKQEVRISAPPKQDLYVVGDKTGHRTVEYLIDNPEQLDHLKKIVPWPIKWIHIVRNPFDCLATWTKKNYENRQRRQVNKPSVEKEFNGAFVKFRALNHKIEELKKTENILTLVHEQVVKAKDKNMDRLCSFLEIEKTDAWRNTVAKTLWKQPRITRRQISWNPKMRKQTMNLVNRFPWLKGYYFGG